MLGGKGMTLAKYSTWQGDDAPISDPKAVAAILRDNRLTIGRLDDYLRALAEKADLHFPQLQRLAKFGFVFQEGTAHLGARRKIAPFFSAGAMALWEPAAQKAIDSAIERLSASQNPDLIRDFCNPAFIAFARPFFGLKGGEDGRILEMIQTTNAVTTPMLPLKSLRAIENAATELAGYFPADPSDQPQSFLALMAKDETLGDEGATPLDIALSTLIASHTLAQSLGHILYAMLLGELSCWQAASQQGWANEALDQLIALYPSTLSLVRVAGEDVELHGCPFHKGQAARLDVIAANRKLEGADAKAARRKHLAFGHGPHKCPGEALSRFFLGLAIPALSKSFPGLAMQREKVAFHVTPMVQYPLSMPCTLNNTSQRLSARLVEIRDHDEARGIVSDDNTWAPPQMEPYLQAVSQRSEKDMSTALLIARNAMFFMSGPRHSEIRLATANLLGGNKIVRWRPHIEEQTIQALERLSNSSDADLISDFSEPLFRGIAQPILGVRPSDQRRFDALAPKLQDGLEPWLPLRDLYELQEFFTELTALISDAPESEKSATSLLDDLCAADLQNYNAVDLRAFVLVLYGASFNLSHTLGNILHYGLTLSMQQRAQFSDPDWIKQNLEQLISLCASPKYIYRMARKAAQAGDIPVRQNETLRLQLLQINRGIGTGNLAFGHGLHRCIGAALTKEVLRAALPRFFATFPDAALTAQTLRFRDMTETVALESLPCRLITTERKL